jgi:hypothetical protein
MIIDATKIWYFQDPPRSSYDAYIPRAFDNTESKNSKVKKNVKTFTDKNKKSKKRRQ